MNKRLIQIIYLLVMLLLVEACGSKKESSSKEDAKNEQKSASGKNAQSSEANKSTESSKDVTPPKELAAFLPKSVEGYALEGEINSSSATIQGFSVSNAEAVYTKGGQNLSISLVDYTAATSVYQGLSTIWQVGLSVENDDEKTGTATVKGHKGFERFDKKNKEAELVLGVNNRFILTIRADNQKDVSLVKSVAESMDLPKLSK